MTTNETEPAPLPDTDRHLYLPDTDRHNKSIIKEHTEYFQKEYNSDFFIDVSDSISE